MLQSSVKEGNAMVTCRTSEDVKSEEDVTLARVP